MSIKVGELKIGKEVDLRNPQRNIKRTKEPKLTEIRQIKILMRRTMSRMMKNQQRIQGKIMIKLLNQLWGSPWNAGADQEGQWKEAANQTNNSLP
jgi:hypothetical protein